MCCSLPLCSGRETVACAGVASKAILTTVHVGRSREDEVGGACGACGKKREGAVGAQWSSADRWELYCCKTDLKLLLGMNEAAAFWRHS